MILGDYVERKSGTFEYVIWGIFKNDIYLKLLYKSLGENFNWQPFSNTFIFTVKDMNVD